MTANLMSIWFIGFVVFGVLFAAARSAQGKNYMDAGAWGFFFGLIWPITMCIVLLGIAGRALNSGTRSQK